MGHPLTSYDGEAMIGNSTSLGHLIHCLIKQPGHAKQKASVVNRLMSVDSSIGVSQVAYEDSERAND